MKKCIIFCISLVLVGAGCIGTGPEEDAAVDYGFVVTPSASNTVIDLSDQDFTSFPSYILERTDIEELDISGNLMTGALPAEIRQLSRLRVLDASDNQFTGVPAEIGQLENLEVLDFSNNQLTGIPHELGNLKALQILDLSGNDISEFDLEIIREGLSPDVEIRL
ncbi:MAG: leucine-rich repeat domain-containing protein [Patescibacteria group bacterium]